MHSRKHSGRGQRQGSNTKRSLLDLGGEEGRASVVVVAFGEWILFFPRKKCPLLLLRRTGPLLLSVEVNGWRKTKKMVMVMKNPASSHTISEAKGGLNRRTHSNPRIIFLRGPIAVLLLLCQRQLSELHCSIFFRIWAFFAVAIAETEYYTTSNHSCCFVFTSTPRNARARSSLGWVLRNAPPPPLSWTLIWEVVDQIRGGLQRRKDNWTPRAALEDGLVAPAGLGDVGPHCRIRLHHWKLWKLRCVCVVEETTVVGIRYIGTYTLPCYREKSLS